MRAIYGNMSISNAVMLLGPDRHTMKKKEEPNRTSTRIAC